MRLLKLMSQAIAQKRNGKSVALADVRKAVSMLELNDNEQTRQVLEYLRMPRPQRSASAELILQLLHETESGITLPWTRSVEQLFNECRGSPPFYKTPALLRGQRKERISDAELLAFAEKVLDEALSTHPGLEAWVPTSDAAETAETTNDAVNPEPFDIIKFRAGLQADRASGGEVDTPAEECPGEEPLDLRSLSATKVAGLARQLREFLGKRLHGQEHVIDTLADGLVHQALRGERRGPLVCLFLIGPPATGKTLTAELIAQALAETGATWPLKSFDMASMVSANQAFALTGMSKGYSEAIPGELTSFVRENPRSIVVLDNLHKAHPNNQNVLLPLFDTGYLKDQFGFYVDNDHTKSRLAPDEVDFRDTILIVTTNAAEGSMSNQDFQAYLEAHPDEATDAVLSLLGNEVSNFRDGPLPSFSSDLLSRLSSEMVLIYRPLPLSALEVIARITWDAFVASFTTAFGCKVGADDLDTVLRAATLSFGGQLDARKVAGSRLENLLFDGVIDHLQQLADEERVAQVRFELSEDFKQDLARLISALSDKDPIRELRRKERKLDFNVQTTRGTDGSIVVRLENPRWGTARRPGDLGVKGGLQTTIPACGFEDIAGHERVKTRLQEIIRLMKEPEKLLEWGVALPRGMLLFGPPGTGKTMLAKALAKEADMPFIASTGPDMLHIEHMHEVFERARHYAPSVLFIDEIDVLGSREGSGYAIPINQLLAELDGFASQAGGVFTVAATNYPRKIDPAILRAGRLDLHVEVPSLDPPARRYFFEKLRMLPGGQALNLDELVQLSSGTTGAELERVRRELGLQLLRSRAAAVTQADAVEMISVVKYGERRDVKSSKLTLEHTAYHEAGHAIVSMVLRPDRKLEQITIVPRARMAGFTAFQAADEMQRPMTREDVLNDLAICLGGRVAQQIKYGEHEMDAGASDDLRRATELAQHAIASWGMDEVVGNRTLLAMGGEVAVAQLPPGRIEWWLVEARSRAYGALKHHRALLDATAAQLCEADTLSEEQFESIRHKVKCLASI